MTIRVASWPAPRTPIAPPYIDPPPPPPAADAASLAVVRARFLEHSLIRPLAAGWAPRTPSSSQTRRGSVARAESALAITERDEAEIAAAVERAQAQLDARAVKTAKRVGPYSPLFAKLGIAEDDGASAPATAPATPLTPARALTPLTPKRALTPAHAGATSSSPPRGAATWRALSTAEAAAALRVAEPALEGELLRLLRSCQTTPAVPAPMHAILSGASEELLKRLLDDGAAVRRWGRHAVLLQPAAAAAPLHVILSGSVSIVAARGAQRVAAAGACVGEARWLGYGASTERVLAADDNVTTLTLRGPVPAALVKEIEGASDGAAAVRADAVREMLERLAADGVSDEAAAASREVAYVHRQRPRAKRLPVEGTVAILRGQAG